MPNLSCLHFMLGVTWVKNVLILKSVQERQADSGGNADTEVKVLEVEDLQNGLSTSLAFYFKRFDK